MKDARRGEKAVRVEEERGKVPQAWGGRGVKRSRSYAEGKEKKKE